MVSLGSSDGYQGAQPPVNLFTLYAESLASLHGYNPRALPPPSSTNPTDQSYAGLSSVIGRTPTKETIWNVGTPTNHILTGQISRTPVAESLPWFGSSGTAPVINTISISQVTHVPGSPLALSTSSKAVTARPESELSGDIVGNSLSPYFASNDRDLMAALVRHIRLEWSEYTKDQLRDLDLVAQLAKPDNRHQRAGYVSQEQFMAFTRSRYNSCKLWHVHASLRSLTKDEKEGIKGVKSMKGYNPSQACYDCFLLGGYFRAKTSDRVKAEGGRSCYCAVAWAYEFL